MVFLDYCEIGTSDFDTLIQKAEKGDKGLSIDAIPCYLDNLPNPENWIKINAAISSKEGEVNAFYLEPSDIKKYDLPKWARGCNRLFEPHQTIVRLLQSRDLPLDLIVNKKVPMRRLVSIFSEMSVEGVYSLKVDTEGHDAVILADVFSSIPRTCYPHQLKFESNKLSDNKAIHELIIKLIKIGYDIVSCQTGGSATDTHMRLNINRVKSRVSFTKPIWGYYLGGYPLSYDPISPPHENNLSDAMRYCKKIGAGGVTFQDERYEVRKGDYLYRQKGLAQTQSWVLIGK